MPTVRTEEQMGSDAIDASDDSSVSSFEDVAEDDNDELSEYENKVELDKGSSSSVTTVVWTGYQKKIPVLMFHADALVTQMDELKQLGERFHLAFKTMKTDCKLVRSVLVAHGFREAPSASNDFNLMWTGSHLKPYVLRTLLDFQKVNHFPRSYEVTRKDRLFKNVQRMQQLKGYKHFDFVPQSFVIPVEYQEFAASKDKGPWIVKPVASSRGRGIFLITSPEQLPLEDNVIVSRYISNPLLIDGFKFDLRLYVAVTSFDPLIIYMYEEGLTRFATVKFDKSFRTLRNQCMHLTNYSVNKKSSDYVQNDDPDVEDYGNKWSLGAMLRYLCSQGIDTTALMMSIEDVVIKTLISVELPIATACKMFMPYRGTCFELFGFDIIIDDKLRPWVLEVNLSPSLACDAPLDLKIKSNMIADLFSLVGFVCQDPVTRKLPHDGSWNVRNRPNFRPQSARTRPKSSLLYRETSQINFPVDSPVFLWRRRPESANLSAKMKPGVNMTGIAASASTSSLSSEEIRVLRRAREEYARRGGWVRIFPSVNSWELYSPYLQYTTTYNSLLYYSLYQNSRLKPDTTVAGSTKHKFAFICRALNLHSMPNAQLSVGLQNNAILSCAMDRCKQYQRKLVCLGQKPGRRKHSVVSSTQQNSSKAGVVAQGFADGFNSGQDEEDTDSESVQNANVTCTSDKKIESRKSLAQGEATDTVTCQSEQTQSIVKLLEGGKIMSKVQARFAFAMYLSCIQRRLMEETHHHADTSSTSGANEQMVAQPDSQNETVHELLTLALARSLVFSSSTCSTVKPGKSDCTFVAQIQSSESLRKASHNLQHEFKVVVPSSKLPVSSRKNLLATQLCDFVQIYNAETNQLKKKLRKTSTVGDETMVDDELFRKFVFSASESHLEEVLTVYTRLSRSSSVFLSSGSRPSSAVGTAAPKSDSSAAKAKKVSEKDKEEKELMSDMRNGKQDKYGSDDGHVSNGVTAAASLPSNIAARLPSQHKTSSYRGAVAAYSAKLSGPSSAVGIRPRPASANIPKISAGDNAFNSRPMTTTQKLSSNSSASPSDSRLQVESQVTDVTATLQQLTIRQKQRQYSATVSSNILTGANSNSRGRHVDVRLAESGDSESDYDNSVESHPVGRQSSVDRTQRRTSSNLRPPEETSAQNSKLTSKEFQQPSNSDYFDNQRSMIEQSRALLEQSKAKHHALVAQAHNMQKRLRRVRSAGTTNYLHPSDTINDLTTPVQPTLAPKPPSVPHSDKKIASHRTQRLARAVSSPHTDESHCTPEPEMSDSGP